LTDGTELHPKKYIKDFQSAKEVTRVWWRCPFWSHKTRQ